MSQMPDTAALAARLESLETKLDALLGAVAGLRMGTLETLTMSEVQGVLKCGRTKVNELVQSGALGMWLLDGERRITRGGLEAFVRRRAAGETGAHGGAKGVARRGREVKRGRAA